MKAEPKLLYFDGTLSKSHKMEAVPESRTLELYRGAPQIHKPETRCELLELRVAAAEDGVAHLSKLLGQHIS